MVIAPVRVAVEEIVTAPVFNSANVIVLEYAGMLDKLIVRTPKKGEVVSEKSIDALELGTTVRLPE
jgi:hypothetical protein